MSDGSAADPAWSLVLAAGAMAESLDRHGRPAWFSAGGNGRLREAEAGSADAVLAWQPGSGWESRLHASDPRGALLELYLPVCSATSTRPMTVGHLGQSLDGFIATASGESQFVTGRDNMIHMHRLRALCDAVLVGAGTVAADDPQLTTRLVEGPSPLRVIYDPDRRLTPTARVFTDKAAPALYACAKAALDRGDSSVGQAAVLGLAAASDGARLAELIDALRGRGCARVFVEGGGVTVSAMLEASLLDRLQIAVAPVLIGRGRPGIRMAPPARLSECRRPAHRVFRMGDDLLFDFDLRAEQCDPSSASGSVVARV